MDGGVGTPGNGHWARTFGADYRNAETFATEFRDVQRARPTRVRWRKYVPLIALALTVVYAIVGSFV